MVNTKYPCLEWQLYENSNHGDKKYKFVVKWYEKMNSASYYILINYANIGEILIGERPHKNNYNHLGETLVNKNIVMI